MTSLPLLGKNIWITRSENRAETLATRIETAGGHPLLFPLFSISAAPLDLLVGNPVFNQILTKLDTYDFAVFVSPNAVDHGLNAMLSQCAWPPGLIAVAPGLATKAALEAQGNTGGKAQGICHIRHTSHIRHILSPEKHFDSEALLDLPAFSPHNIHGKKVLIVRGNGGRAFLAENLQKRGALVDCLAVYRRQPVSDLCLKQFLQAQRIDALAVFSSACLQRIVSMIDSGSETFSEGVLKKRVENSPETAPENWRSLGLLQRPLFTPYRRISEAAKAQGWKNSHQTGPDESDIIESLNRYNWRHE